MITRLFKVLGPEAGPLRAQLATMVIAAVLQGVGFVLLVPLLRALLTRDTSTAWAWTGALAAVLAAYAVAHYWSQMAGYQAAVGLSRGLFERLGDHIARLPLGWFEGGDGGKVGKLGQLTSQGVIDVMGVPAHLLRPIVNAVVTPLTVVLLMFVFDWRLALAALAGLPLAYLVYVGAGRLIARADTGHDAAAVDAADRLVEFAQTQAVLRAYGRTVDGVEQLDAALVAHNRAGRRLLIMGVPGIVSFALVVQAVFVLLVVVGVRFALDGSLPAPELLALLVLAVRFVEPLSLVADVGGGLAIARNSLDRMDTLLSTNPLPEPARPSPPSGDASVELDAVTFGYEPGRPVLRHVSLDVPAGSMTALVGASGSGKTTITRLIARFWDVDAGAVRIGGVDVRDLSNEALMAQLAMVFQATYLFDGTIAENLRLARPDASHEELERVAALARVDEIIERLPGGWDARVGEGGTSLSGGERQRVAIARALLKDAPILLLDEATAALDPANEVAVQNAIDELRSTHTIIVIAHRLSTVVAADQIVVLHDGGVAERGTHDELLMLDGRYAAFWHERSRAAGWRLDARI